MPELPLALVISDFPIVAVTAGAVLGHRHDVVVRTWASFAEQPNVQADLVIVDVTTVSRDMALTMMSKGVARFRLVVCSLYRNEVEIYRVEAGGLHIEGALPTLLALAA